MARVKVEIDVDEDMLRWADSQAQRSGQSRDEIIEQALRRHQRAEKPLTEILRPIWERSDLTADQALEIANTELAAARAERDAARQGMAR